jgi:valyl-tRNA synthetase
LQDILIRAKRMDGYNTLWVPGTDHASIAVHVILDRQLEAEGKTRQDLGREAFLERAWRWKEESGGTITRQLRRLGASCDWTREHFTMDAGLSRAVREAFVRLYDEGRIYQGDYIVNWCPRCQTVLADLEVEREERDAEFVYIKRTTEAIAFSRGKLSRPDFTERAPAEIVDKEREKLAEQAALHARLVASLSWVG